MAHANDDLAAGIHPAGNLLRLPSYVVWGLLGLAVLPFILGASGVDLGTASSPEPFAALAAQLRSASPELDAASFESQLDELYTEPMFRRLRGSFSHTFLEWSAFCVALFTAMLAYAYSRVRGDKTVAIIGMALFFAGVMDAFHTLAADRLIEAVAGHQDLIPFTWAICRLFNALIPVVGIALFYALRRKGNWTSLGNLAAIGVAFLFLAYAIIHLCATRQQLPTTTYPDALVTRPWDVAPLCIYLASGLFIFPRFYRSSPSIFSYALMVSVIPNVATQLYMVFGSEQLFDHAFNAAHALKILAYLVPCLGLIMDYMHTERALMGHVAKLAQSHAELTAAHAAADEREQELQGVLNGVLVGVVTIDEKGVVQAFNPEAERLFGYAPREMLGQNVSRLMPEPYRSQHDGHLERYLRTGESKVMGQAGRRLPGVRRDGSQFPVEVCINEIRLAGRRLFIASLLDLTQRVHDEQALLEQSRAVGERARDEHILRRIFERFGDGNDLPAILTDVLAMLAVDHEFPVSGIYLLDEWTGVLGLTAGHALPATAAPIALGEGLVGQAGKSRTPLFVGVQEGMSLTVSAGPIDVVPAALAALPINRAERLLGVLLVASTVPFSREGRAFLETLCLQLAGALTSQQQYQSLKTLSDQSRRQTEEIREANAELRRASRLKSEFLANMSHELRTPLNAIIGFSDVLRDGIVGDVQPEQREYLEEISQSGTHLLTLINDILDLSKIEAGKMSLQISQFDARMLLEGCLNIVKEPALKADITLSLDLADDLGEVWLDQRKLKQIVYNLLANAVKFTGRNGRVWLEARRLPATATQPERLELVVGDTGIGIPSELQSRLFQPFEQLDGSLTRRHGGTGLGLHLVKRMVEFHSGEIEVDSAEGTGSRFTVRLPCVAPSATLQQGDVRRAVSESPQERAGIGLPSSAQPGIPRPTGTEEIVLLALGDQNGSVEALAQQLRGHGYRSVRVMRDALSLEQRHDAVPDLILAVLASGDSADFLTRLAAHPAYHNVPIVLLVSAQQAGEEAVLVADAVIEKPVDQRELLRTVSRLIAGDARASVLIVDDDPNAVRVLTSFLQRGRFDLEVAYGGREALELVERCPPALILLDLMMPEMSGFEVLQRLKASPTTAGIPVVIVTAKTLSDQERSLLETQAAVVTQKAGMNRVQLLRVVRSILARRGGS